MLLAISRSRDAGWGAHLPPVRDRGFAGCEWLRRSFSPVSPSMTTLREILQTPPLEIERRAVGRTTNSRDVLMFFAGQEGVRACSIRNVTNHGAGLRLKGLSIVPSRIWHLVRQFPHDAPLPIDLARRRLCRRGIRKLYATSVVSTGKQCRRHNKRCSGSLVPRLLLAAAGWSAQGVHAGRPPPRPLNTEPAKVFDVVSR